MGRPAIAIAITVVAAAAIFLWIKRGSSSSPGRQDGAVAATGPSAAKPSGQPSTPGGDVAKSNISLPRGVRRLRAKQDRERLLRAIEAARSKREGRERGTGSPSNGSGLQPTGSAPELPAAQLDAKYIRSVVRGALPLLRECFTLARDSAPDAEGKVVVEFTIVGEKDIGGLVESATIISDNALSKNKAMAECVTETMMSLEYAAPEDGGKVMVKYPFVFRHQ